MASRTNGVSGTSSEPATYARPRPVMGEQRLLETVLLIGRRPPPSAPSFAPQPSNPERPDKARRLPWPALLERVFGIDVLTCDRCGASRRIIAFIEQPAVARRILEHLGLPSTGPPRTEPRPRPQLDFLDARPSAFA